MVTGAGFSANVCDANPPEITPGVALLAVTPNEALDSTAVIDNIRILDARYRTSKNVTTLSTFKDIKDSYKINRIDNSINSINVKPFLSICFLFSQLFQTDDIQVI